MGTNTPISPLRTPRIAQRDHGRPLRGSHPLWDHACLLRRLRRWSLEDQEHAERRQEAEALGGPVGQADDGPRPPSYRISAWTDRPGCSARRFRAEQWLEG